MAYKDGAIRRFTEATLQQNFKNGLLAVIDRRYSRTVI
jgi:hypothetical protein